LSEVVFYIVWGRKRHSLNVRLIFCAPGYLNCGRLWIFALGVALVGLALRWFGCGTGIYLRSKSRE